MNPFKINSGYFNSVKWGSYSLALGFIRQIILVPVFLTTVGKDKYALWLILYTIALMIRSLNLGQLHYTSNLVNLSYHIKQDITTELSLGQGANIICMSFQFLLGITVSFPVILNLFSNLPVDYLISSNAQYSLALLVFSRVIHQYVTLYLLRLFEPIGKIQTTIKYQTIGEVIDLGVTAAALYVTHSIAYTSAATFLFSIFFLVWMYVYVGKNVPFTLLLYKNIDYKGSVKVIRQSSLLTFSFIVEKIYENGLNLVIARAYTASILPQFDTNRKMSNAFYRASNVVVAPILPGIQKEFTLKNEKYILDKMMVFWRFSTAMFILCVTIGMPLFSIIYTKWTGNTIRFNVNLICYLFMAIAFQNYSLIIIEFFKKTNLSKQMLITNIVKVSITIICLFLFGYYGLVSGLGGALLIGEIIAIIYILLVMVALFNASSAIRVFVSGLIPVVLVSISLMVYMNILNYKLFFACNALILLYTLWPLRIAALKFFK